MDETGRGLSAQDLQTLEELAERHRVAWARFFDAASTLGVQTVALSPGKRFMDILEGPSDLRALVVNMSEIMRLAREGLAHTAGSGFPSGCKACGSPAVQFSIELSDHGRLVHLVQCRDCGIELPEIGTAA